MVPVLDQFKQPLMPCSEKRARKLLERKEAKPYWYKGIFTIILQKEPSDREYQDICIGIDPGSKFNGYSIKSEANTIQNLQVEAVTTVKRKVEERAMLRVGRRQRKTQYRKCKFNNKSKIGFIPPSTRARWQQHLNIIRWMRKLYKITHVAVEDIKAKLRKGCRKWNRNFSPLQTGKNWFYNEVLKEEYLLYKFQGYDTYEFRQKYGFKKNSNKSKKDWYTHCVDAWVLANEVIGGHTTIDNTKTYYLKPIMFHRRKLHEVLPKKNGKRRNYGGTISLGFKRGALVKHPKWGKTIIGGTSKGRITLYHLSTEERLCRNAKIEDIRILSIIRYRNG